MNLPGNVVAMLTRYQAHEYPHFDLLDWHLTHCSGPDMVVRTPKEAIDSICIRSRSSLGLDTVFA